MDYSGGVLLLIVAGAISGSFTLPMKLARRWAWENTWLAWTIFALILFPVATALTTVPHLWKVYAGVDLRLIAMLAAFGLFWGVTQVLFGLAVDAIGVALAFAIVPAMSAAIGSLVPLFRFHLDELRHPAAITVMLGVVLICFGVTACALAGTRRFAGNGNAAGAPPRFRRGLLLAVCSGAGAAMVSLGLAFSGPLLESARKWGAGALWAPNAVWLPVMLAGAVANVLYCLYLMRRQGTARRFADRATAHYWGYAFAMALCWFGSITLYGIAIDVLGSWGSVLGWPIFTSLILVTASIWGLATGEWKQADNGAVRLQLGGVALLIAAVFTLSSATRWLQ